MSRKRVLRRKPISFDTTLRNPRRIPQFISILKEFEGDILDDNTALMLEAEIICQKIFIPTKSTLGTYVLEYNEKFQFQASDLSSDAIFKVSKYFDEWLISEPGEFSRDKMLYLLTNTITAHKEAGWRGGWESRLHTQFNFLNELGFVRVVKDKKVIISETGKLMIHEYDKGYPKNEVLDETYEESAFLNAFAKYQVNNPYRSNTIKVNFFPLILSTIKILKSKYNRSGLSINDLPFVICWDNNNSFELAKIINEYRDKFGYNTSTDQNYEYAINLLDETTPNRILGKARSDFILAKNTDYKFDKITRETPDEIIRKMRLTMLLSLRGGGRFIDLNTLEMEKIDQVIEKYSKNIDFNGDYEAYLDFMGDVDQNLIFPKEEPEKIEALNAKEIALKAWAIESNWDLIKSEMLISVNKGQSNHPILKYVTETVRLEFLTAIALKKALPNATISANYKADDQGIPFGVALGARNGSVGSDIDVFEDDVHALVEPTISKSRSFQTEHEIPSIRNHVLESNKYDLLNRPNIKNWFALLIASNISRDVGDQAALIRQINKVEIYPWEIEDFIENSKGVFSIRDYQKIRPYAIPQTLE